MEYVVKFLYCNIIKKVFNLVNILAYFEYTFESLEVGISNILLFGFISGD